MKHLLNIQTFAVLLLVHILLVPCIVFAEKQSVRTIKVGALFSLSGWGGEGGTSELNGLRLAADDINAAGGIAGRSVELVVEDNRSGLKQTAAALSKLVSIDQVKAIIGPNWSEFTEVAAPLAQKYKTVMITPSGYVDNAIASNSYVFSMWPPHETATAPLAEFISNSKPRALYALISQNAYYEANYRALEQQLKQSGIKIVGVQRFSENHKDFRSEISRLKKLKADAVIAFLLESGDLSSFFKQAKQLKLPAQIYTANGIPFSEIIRANPGIADDVVYFDFHTPGNQKFLKRYRDTFGMNAGFASARAYDALYILKQAFESCGIESSRLRECIQNTNLSGVTGPVRFDQAGVIANSSNHSYLLKVVSGKFVVIDRPRKYS